MASSAILKLFFSVFFILVWTDFILAASKESAMTDAKTEHLIYEWTIKNFHRFPQKPGEYINSSVFRTEDKRVEWSLRFYPHGPDDKRPDTVSVFLELLTPKAAELKMKVHFVLSILESKNILNSGAIDYVYDRAIGQGFPEFVPRSKLLTLPGQNHQFTIRAEIDLPTRAIMRPFDPLEEQMSHDLEKNRLTDDFRKLFGSDEFSDDSFMVETGTFPVHRVVLATRSSVLAKMVKGDATDQYLILLGLEDPVVLEAILEFIYTDDVADLEALAYLLLPEAEYFKLPRLKTMIEMVLYKSLNVDNAADILELADLHHSHKLKRHVMEFMVSHFSAMEESKGFKQLGKKFPKLVDELNSASLQNSQASFC